MKCRCVCVRERDVLNNMIYIYINSFMFMGFSGFCMASLHTVLTVCALSSESVSMAFTFCLSFGLPEGWNSADASFPFRAPLFLWILCSFLFEICPTRDERLYYTLEVWKSGLKKIISLGNFLHNEENSTALFFSPMVSTICWCLFLL